MGVNFFIRKKAIRGGPRGGLAKDHKKYGFFSAPFPYPCMPTKINQKVFFEKQYFTRVYFSNQDSNIYHFNSPNNQNMFNVCILP